MIKLILSLLNKRKETKKADLKSRLTSCINPVKQEGEM